TAALAAAPVLLFDPDIRVADLAARGVRRVSVGGALAKAAWAGFDEAARLLRDRGVMSALRFAQFAD
ncbi:MAG: isocitrate lyase/phosphoenolpyruvate mutase family protein, partial [Gemmatimonadota bacterium]